MVETWPELQSIDTATCICTRTRLPCSKRRARADSQTANQWPVPAERFLQMCTACVCSLQLARGRTHNASTKSSSKSLASSFPVHV